MGWTVAVTGLVLVAGCWRGVYQTPETLPLGSCNWGGSVEAMLITESESLKTTPIPIPVATVSTRRGLADRLDGGLTWHLPTGLTADLKYQFLRGSVNGALDLPLTVFLWPTFDLTGNTDSVGARSMADARPTLLVGYRWLRAGALLDLSTLPWFSRSHVHPGVLLGATIGSRIQLLPEITVYPLGQGMIWTIGCAVTATSRR
jgi:hypothetical protein